MTERDWVAESSPNRLNAWDEPADGGVSRYGFRWGPMIVTRLAHITRRGYVLGIETPHQSMQVYVSDKGRKIRAYDPVQRCQHKWGPWENDVAGVVRECRDCGAIDFRPEG